MQVVPGVRLGPYEIVASVGAGGMGEVYRARDTRLDRTVAVKVLPAQFANDAQLRLRFEREAKAISSLTHPHICTLHDIGQQDGTDYLVMEFLEGETLADRLLKGPLGVEQALVIAVQITDALDKAHKQGIVHRDLKPGNIMLTRNGAKLLDFGLAKYGPQPEGNLLAGATSFRTEQKSLTQEGSIVGTFQYMAPEQLEGKEAAARTDIFALGAVLYEMLTARHAFQGKSRVSLIAAILEHDPPPITSIQPLSPPALERLIRICLAKDPDDRWQTAHDVLLQLKWIGEGGSQVGVPAPVAVRRRHREMISAIALALAIVGAATFATLWYRVTNKPRPVVHTSILPPEKWEFAFESAAPVLSPDGTRIVFLASDGSNRTLWVRALSAGTAQPLAGTDGASYPFWSPDGRYLGYFTGGKMKKVDANGGPSQVLCDVSSARGGAWAENDTIIFAQSSADGLFKVSAAGGVPVAVTRLDKSKNEASHRWPFILPDQKHVVFLALSAGNFRADANGTHVASIEDGKRQMLAPSDSGAVYSPSGYLLYRRDRTLVAHPFDAKSRRLKGEPFPVAEDVRMTQTQQGIFTVSGHGHLAFQSGGALGLSQLTWVDRAGKTLGTVGTPGDYRHAILSHDGRRVAVQRTETNAINGDIWTIDLTRGTSTRLTFDPANDFVPVWSPDDGRVLFSSNRKDAGDLYKKTASGVGSDEALVQMDGFTIGTDWSRDGRHVALQNLPLSSKNGWDLWVYSMAEEKSMPFLQTEFNESQARFSPDGKWIAYVSDESGRLEVYAQSFPSTGGKWQVSTEGGSRPQWSPRGDEIFYVNGAKLFAVNVSAGTTFEAGIPQPLFDVRLKGGPDSFFTTPDGQRFLLNSAVKDEVKAPITLVQNWDARRSPR